jgi:class 3 adenylate cyclase/tetratricopeptide (TPR) repeat protein
MKCPKCQFENPDEATFCIQCGNPIEFHCPKCGTVTPRTGKFCMKCGLDLRKPEVTPPIDYPQPQSYTPKYLAEKILTTRSSIEGERKLVTVLFADVANYTSISEKLDPEEVHQIMDGCFRILVDEIHRCEGTIDKFTGDGVMALFGAPVAHEDHAQRGCHAALSIQKAVRAYGEKVKEDPGVEFKMRIGLNSGPVIVGTIGDDLKMDYTAIGDTTNLASRMEAMARPGIVLVSGNTHKLARDYFEFASLGKVAVKGKEKPQETYELVRRTEVETRIEAAAAKGLTRFVGRRKEMEILREASRKARSGSGQIVGILGDAGVGKSRLLLEFRASLPMGEHTYLEGSCLHYGRSIVYLPILDILKSFFNIQEGDQEDDVQAKVRERLGQLDGKLLGALAPLQDVLSLTIEDKAYLQVDAQQKRQRVFEAIRNSLVRASQDKPLVLVMEDLHWIDKTSQDFLDFFAEAVSDAPILLILLYRPEYSQSGGSRPYCHEITLDQLSAKTSSELVQVILEEGEVVPELRELILGRAGGNPLFVEELTQSLLENGSILRKDHQYVLAGKPSEIQVPDTIQGIIAARMDRLEESLKRIMQVASVIGQEFAYRILSTLIGRREDLKGSLLNLQSLEFIYEKQLFPELEYIFKHALTQEVAYNSLLVKRRRELHEKIGAAIEQVYAERLEGYYEILAYHYVHSDNASKAVEYLDLANQKTARANALEDAKAYFDKAMELLDTLPETEENQERRISMLVNQRYVFLGLFRFPDYHELLVHNESVAAEKVSQGLRGSFYGQLGACEWSFGYFDQAVQTLSRAAGLCEASGKTEEAGTAYFSSAFSHLYRGDYEKVLIVKEQTLDMMDVGDYVKMLTIASSACSELGRWHEAVELGQKALSRAEESSDSSLIHWPAFQLCAAYTLKRDFVRAIQYGELSITKAATIAQKAVTQGTLARAWCYTGEPERGIEVLVRLNTLYQAARFVPGLLANPLYLAEGYWLAGEYDKARETAEELLELSERCGARGYLGKAHRLLGEVALETNAEEAAPHFDQAISIFLEIRTENDLALAYSGMGRLHKQHGNTEQAREYLTKALEIFERLGTLIEPDKVRKELGELTQ